MQNKFFKLSLIFFAFAGYTSLFAESRFLIDKEHTSLEFEIAHLVISTVKGRFDNFEGSITLDDNKSVLTSIQGTAEANSINTNQEKRDKHLKSADFFDVSKFPKLEFEAKGIKLNKGKSAKVKGLLTMHGIQKQVTVSLTFKGIISDPWGTEKAVVDAETIIKRKDFGLNWNEALEAGGVMVGEEVKILIKSQSNFKP